MKINHAFYSNIPTNNNNHAVIVSHKWLSFINVFFFFQINLKIFMYYYADILIFVFILIENHITSFKIPKYSIDFFKKLFVIVRK